MDTVNTNSTTSTGNYSYTQNCPQRLPCGLCRLTNSYCPLCGVTLPNPPYTWGVNLTGVGEKTAQIALDSCTSGETEAKCNG